MTRPADQAEALCALIEAGGGLAIRAPLLEIEPTGISARASMAPAGVDWLVFVSANAVRFSRLIPEAVRGAKIAAIGQATAQALMASGFTVDLKPKQQFNSESLLALPPWQDVAGLRFLIVRGEGGRETLAETLSQRGAEVAYASVYRRIPAHIDRQGLLDRWRKGEIEVVSITSGEALDYLVRLMEESGMELLQQTPMVVIGERLE
ncbi:MAG: uroporphyrinogen-III synthase, partial [Methylococcaceae bacterium]|nr:uroporphyrinogen-III synthase [Methylococcaceae bacterium]